jgi:hypothetical protein
LVEEGSVKRVLFAAVLAGVVAAVPSALGRNPIEPPRTCDGLTICGPVAGPWVVVPGPASGAGTASSVWMLECPRGVVGGTDARVGDGWVDVTFAGRVGAPVNPGITTGRTVVFTGMSVGPAGRPSSFIPFVGCIPSEGGPRAPTAVGALRPSTRAVGPHEAIVRRIRVLDLQRRHVSAGLGCKRGERLVSATTAIGLYTALKPSISQLRGVRVTRSVVGGRIFVTADRVGLPLSVPVEVQVHALCTGAA